MIYETQEKVIPPVRVPGVLNTRSTMLSFNMRRTLFRGLVRPTLDIKNIKNFVIQKAISFCVIALSAALGFPQLLLSNLY